MEELTRRQFVKIIGLSSAVLLRETRQWGQAAVLPKANGYSTFVFADAACEFIERNKHRPFLCYVPFNAAHYPNPKNKPPGTPCLWQAPDEAFARYGYSPKTLDERKRYRAVVTALDDGVGRVLDKLDRYKLIRERYSTNQEWQLFDLQTDIGETANLLASRPELAEHLKAEYERWEKEATSGR